MTDLPPMPPKYPGYMDKMMTDVEPQSFAMTVWDALIAVGPLPYGPRLRAVLPPVSQVSASWHEYQRYHPEWYKKDGSAVEWEKAYREHIHRALDHGVRRGWLAVTDGGVYSAVLSDDLPNTSWTPLPDRARPIEKTTLTFDYPMPIGMQKPFTAITFGKGMSDPAMIAALKVRAKSDPKKKAELKHNLREVGQLYPIVRWRRGPDHDWQIIDGATREELLLKICEETNGVGCEPIKYMDLPYDVPLQQVLAFKIATELTGSTKTEEARNTYIKELAELGIDHVKISKAVGVSRSQITTILNAQGVYKKGKIDTHKDEILAMRAAGWSQRDIAAETGFQRVTVQKALERWDQEAGYNVSTTNIVSNSDLDQPASTPVKLPTGNIGKCLTALAVELGGGPATRRQMTDAAGVVQNALTTAVTNGWIKRGLVTATGSMFTITDLGLEVVTKIKPKPPVALVPVDIDWTVQYRDELEKHGWALSKDEFLAVLPIFASALAKKPVAPQNTTLKEPSQS